MIDHINLFYFIFRTVDMFFFCKIEMIRPSQNTFSMRNSPAPYSVIRVSAVVPVKCLIFWPSLYGC